MRAPLLQGLTKSIGVIMDTENIQSFRQKHGKVEDLFVLLTSSCLLVIILVVCAYEYGKLRNKRFRRRHKRTVAGAV